MGQISYGTITIIDTGDIENIYIEYIKTSSSTSAPSQSDSGWSTSTPTWENGKYIWSRTATKYTGIVTPVYSSPVCITGGKGETGGKGDTGTAVSSITPLQYLHTSESSSPGKPTSTVTSTSTAAGQWTKAQPTWVSGKYMWTCTEVKYSNNTYAWTDPICANSMNKANSDAANAVSTANSAASTASAAAANASSALTAAQNTQTALNNYKDTNDTAVQALQSRASHFWWDSAGAHVASGTGTMSSSNVTENDPSTHGFNALMAPGALSLREKAVNLVQLATNALTFYIAPNGGSQGPKALEVGTSGMKIFNPVSSNNIALMELSSGAISFKDLSGNVQATFGNNGAIQSGNYSRGSAGTKFAAGGTKIDLINGEILTRYFRLSQGVESSVPAGAYIYGTVEAIDGKIGSNTNNYWYIGNYTDYNQNQSAAIKSYGSAFIQLGNSSTWRLATNRIHGAWNDDGGGTSGLLHYPDYNNKYWDSGLHLPTSLTDKFLYIRNAPNTEDLENLQNDLDDLGYDYWTYRFYVAGDGSVYARNIYVLDDNGNITPIGGADGVYLLKSGGTMTGSITMSNGGKFIGNLQGTADNASKVNNHTVNSDVPSGAIFTDKNVQTTQANTTKLYITGTATNGTNTGTLSYDSNVYLNTTAGDLRATTFNGYTLAAASAKGVDTSLTASSTSTNLPTSAAVVNLIKQYLPLTGGNVTGAVSFGSSVSADELTVGDLVVNGAASFTNNLQANTINGVEVGVSPKFTDTVTTVTTSGNGNAVTAITASNGKLTVTKGTTFLTSYTETDPIFVASAAHGITSSDISNWNSKTSNTGTVTSVKVEGSNGLTGSGTVTTSGTITLSHADTSSQASSSNSGRTYIQSVTLDSYGHVTGLSTATETVTDTHYIANLITGASATAKANAAATNGNVYLNLVENNTVRNAHKITGSGTTTVTSDADGNITISSADSKVGTVTSITLTQGTGISIGNSGTAITTSGTRTIALADNYGDTKNPYANKTARYVLAAPANAAGAPSFRALTGADVGLGNVLNAAQVTGIGQGADGKIRVYKGDSNYEDVAVEIVATESSSVASAQKLTSYGGSTKQPVYFPNSGTNAGKPVAIGYTIETSVPSGAVFTDTTYTFANGTNGFTVTPLNGTAQTVTVTPSIANNITGSGTSGYLAKFNGANTITNGPALGTDTTKFLNNKGEWAIPTNTNTTYTLTNALSSHKFTWTFTAGGSGSGSTTTILELVQGSNITLTDDATNKKVTIAAKDTTYSAGSGLTLSGTTFKHSNSITAGTAGTSSATSSTNRTISIPYITYDAQGHITGTGTHTHTIDTYPEAYLAWGGRNLTGSITPVGMSISAEHSANRIAFLNPAAIDIEYTTDGGSTWVDSGYDDSQKMWLCTGTQFIAIGQSKTDYSASTALTTNHWTRVTLTGQNGTTQYVYTDPRKLLVNMSTALTVDCLIEYKTGASGAEWKTFGTYAVTGWSGWNDIPLILDTFGGGTSQTSNNWYLRFTFKVTSTRTDNYKGYSGIYGLRLFGTNDWGSASNNYGKGPISATGHLYRYDANANATFPAQITATQFNGNATTATKLKQTAVTGQDNCMPSNGDEFQVFRTTTNASGADGHIMAFNWSGTATYGAQLYIDTDPTYDLSIRQRDGSGNWNAWKHIITENNYNSFSPTLTGSGASGTWGISISGNAATATSATSATTSSKTGDGGLILYAHNQNEVNFGGTNASSAIYLGYRAMDNKPIPSKFVFGGSTGTADLQVKSIYLGSDTSSYISSTNYTGKSATSGTADLATTTTTTADTSNALYPIGVTSGATTTLKRNTSITMTGGSINATNYIMSNKATMKYDANLDAIVFQF